MGFDAYSSPRNFDEEGCESDELASETCGRDYNASELEGINISYDEARRLFEEGIRVEPSHGILYNAYG